MIALLRAGALLVNVFIFVGIPQELGAPGWAIGTGVTALFLLCRRACRTCPPGTDAPDELHAEASLLAIRMGVKPPAFLRMLPGWTAGAVANRTSYGLLLGTDVEARHRGAVLAHEIAHVKMRDLWWEPLTDGPLRLLIGVARRLPIFYVIVFPFALFGVPLARATELAADEIAARFVPTYPVILQEVASLVPRRESLLYPSLARRIRHAARHSLQEPRKGK